MELEVVKAEEIKEERGKPTPEETKQAQEDFESSNIKFNSTLWEIGEPDKAETYLDFLMDHISNNVTWKNNEWMGVIKIHDELTNIKKALPVDKKFTLGYQAMEFLYAVVNRVEGVGLESAKKIEKTIELRMQINEVLTKTVDAARKELLDVQRKQERYASYLQGFYYEPDDAIAKEEAESTEPPIGSVIP